jgi:hypothetical protein
MAQLFGNRPEPGSMDARLLQAALQAGVDQPKKGWLAHLWEGLTHRRRVGMERLHFPGPLLISNQLADPCRQRWPGDCPVDQPRRLK